MFRTVVVRMVIVVGVLLLVLSMSPAVIPGVSASTADRQATEPLAELQFILMIPPEVNHNVHENVAFLVKTGSSQDTVIWRAEAERWHNETFAGQGYVGIYTFDVSGFKTADGRVLRTGHFENANWICIENISNEAFSLMAAVVIGTTVDGKTYVLNANLDWPEDGWLSAEDETGVTAYRRRNLNGERCYQ